MPRATAAINTLRQIGGSIGTALLAVVLQHESKAALSSAPGASGGLLAPLPASERAQISGPVATAFGHTLMWAVALALLALIRPSRSCAPSGGRGPARPATTSWSSRRPTRPDQLHRVH